MIELSLVAFGGKLLGGFIADRIGWIICSVGALLISVPLIAYGGHSAATVLTGLLIFQMTMPVTLYAVYLLLPQKPATAFGLPCLALIIGASPTFYHFGRSFYGSTTFAILILLSAAAVAVGLKLLRVR